MASSRRAQIIVELALALPVLMLLMLGGIEAGFLLTAKAHQDRQTAVAADYAAEHPDDESWHAVAERELPGCDVTVTMPLPDLVEVRAICHHASIVLPIWQGLEIGSRETAAVRPEPASPSLGPTGSPSSSSTRRPERQRA